MNLNLAVIVGRTTKKPELKKTTGGNSVTSFSLATSEVYTDKAGAKQESVEFHNVVLWGKTAETVCQFIDKGQLLLVQGKIVTREWEDKDKNKRRTTEIVGHRVQFGPKAAGRGGKEVGVGPISVEAEPDGGPRPEEIPF